MVKELYFESYGLELKKNLKIFEYLIFLIRVN